MNADQAVLAPPPCSLPAPAAADAEIQSPALPAAKPGLAERLVSLDVYRGLIMVTLAFTGFGLARTADNHLKQASSTFWQAIYFQFEHVEWTGCGYWDLIQPSFMFMVGVAMAFSCAKRQRLGQPYGKMLVHAMWRSLALIVLGILLAYDDLGNWGLMNVLTQIGLGYTFLFLLWGRPLWVQCVAAAAILAGTWLLYVLAAGPITGARDAGLSLLWTQTNLEGLDSAWHKCANVGQDIDLWLLNALPRSAEYVISRGGYQTINFIPSLVTMLFGLMCGELLRSALSARRKVLTLALTGLGGLIVGEVLHQTGVCPLVKRIWTPTWALYSTGWCCLILAGLYASIDVLGYRRWTFPLVVVGMNSIAIYAMSMRLKGAVTWPLRSAFGDKVFEDWAGLYWPMVQYTFIGLVFWIACYALYRFKIFVRI